jgi:hypothetical protein
MVYTSSYVPVTVPFPLRDDMLMQRAYMVLLLAFATAAQPGGVPPRAVVRAPLPAAQSTSARAVDQGVNPAYDGRIVFTRIRYGGGFGSSGWRGGASWAHDYPRADSHLSVILDEITSMSIQVEETNVLTLEDPQLFRNPIIYISEPGFWQMNEIEVRNLRNYLLKGGFLIFDDFENEQLRNVEVQMRRALPEHHMIEIDASHPIFHSFFDVTAIYFPHPMVNVTPVYYGIFEDNDPTKRMIAIVNHNNDLAEFWEWSDSGWLPVDNTNEAYKLGVNYMVYGLTH